MNIYRPLETEPGAWIVGWWIDGIWMGPVWGTFSTQQEAASYAYDLTLMEFRERPGKIDK